MADEMKSGDRQTLPSILQEAGQGRSDWLWEEQADRNAMFTEVTTYLEWSDLN